MNSSFDRLLYFIIKLKFIFTNSLKTTYPLTFTVGCYFDKFPEQCDPFSNILAQAELGADPVLHFIEASHEHVQIGSDVVELVSAEYLVDKLVRMQGVE